MNSVVLENVSIGGLDKLLSIVIVDGIITCVDEQGPSSTTVAIDYTRTTVLPGFVDLHNHGAVGVDVNEADVDGLVSVAEFLARHGVTSWLPTLVPDCNGVYVKVVEAIERLMIIQHEMPIAQAVGVHYEGIFANEKMCGALRPEYFKKFTGAELAEIPRLTSGVHMTTFAPEVEGGIELVKALRNNGWTPSIGHTKADIQTLDLAFDAGATHVTHFFNAMTGIHHRDVGVAGWALTKEGVTFDIIADGIHVDRRMVQFACRAKGTADTVLISDSVAPTGLGDGEFELWGEKVIVEKGRTRNERGSIAGSVITMADAARIAINLGFSPAEVGQMAATNPARVLGLKDRGRVAVGQRADLVAINSTGNVEWTMIGGKIIGA